MTASTVMTGSTTSASDLLPGSTSPYVLLAEHRTYEQAQRHVDALSDAGFPVASARIVGHELTSVEQVTGRLTKGRAALYGAASGAWFGVFAGLLLGLFLPAPAWLALLLTAAVIGAVWGAAFGFLAHWSTRGRRDFTSARGLRAARYTVEVLEADAAEARRLVPAA